MLGSSGKGPPKRAGKKDGEPTTALRGGGLLYAMGARLQRPALACSLLTDNPMQWAVWIATAGLWSQALGSGACP